MSDKILVVDDEPATLQLLQTILERKGYTVVRALDGNEALEKVRAEKPDLMVLDIMMPGVSGIEVCQRVRSDPAMAKLPIIMLTARSEVAIKVLAFEAGADEYVTKPISAKELEARVKALLDRTRRLVQQARPPKLNKVISFIGAKGGVGTTTTALNIAAALAGQGYSTIAVELRSYVGAFAQQLNQEPRRSLSDLLERDPGRIGPADWSESLYNISLNFQVLFGPQKPDRFQEISPEMAQAMIEGLSPLADYAVIDLPSSPSIAAKVAISRANYVAVVLEPEPMCVSAAKAMVALLNSWGASQRLIGAIVVNRVSLPTAWNPEQVAAQLACEVIGTVPRATEACVAAREAGVPLVLYDPMGVAAMNLRDIAAKIVRNIL